MAGFTKAGPLLLLCCFARALSAAGNSSLSTTPLSFIDTTVTTTVITDSTKVTHQVLSTAEMGSTATHTTQQELMPATINNTSSTQTSLTVRWNYDSGEKDGFIVTCRSSSEDSRTVNASANDTSATCIGLTPGRRYTVYITTWKMDWKSVISNRTVVQTILTGVTGIHVSRKESTSLTITWNHARGSKENYVVECSGVANSLSETPVGARQAVDETVNSTTCSPLTPGSKYSVTITTIKNGWSNVSANLSNDSAKTDLSPVTNLTVVAEETSLSVTWQHGSGDRGGYKVMCQTSSEESRVIDLLKYNTTLMFDNLTPGTEYNVTVMTVKSGWDVQPVVSQVTKTLLAGVTGIHVSRKESTSLTITWNHARGSKENYVVECSGVANSLSETPVGARQTVDGTVNSTTCSPLTPGSKYSVTITTIKNGWSNVSANLSTDSAKTDLSPVTNLTVVAEETSLSVTWQHGSGDRGGYKVMCQTSSEESRIIDLLKNNTTLMFDNLTPGTEYNVTVMTVKSGWDVQPVVSQVKKTLLAGVTGIHVSRKESTSLTITWNHARGSKENYVVECSGVANSLSETPVGARQTVDGTVNSTTCSPLTPGSKYSVTITTIKNGWSNVSANLSTDSAKTDLSPVTNLTVVAEETSLSVTWQHGSGDRGGYKVMCQTSSEESRIIDLLKNNTTLMFDNLTPGTEYNVTVMTVKSGWDVQPVVSQVKKTLLAGVTGIHVSRKESTSLTITWNHARGSKENYVVECSGVANSLSETPVGARQTVDGTVNSTTCSPLTPGSKYSVTITTIKNGWSNVSANLSTDSAKTDLAAATELSVAKRNATSLSVTWTHAIGSKEKYVLVCTASPDRELETPLSGTMQVDGNINYATCASLSPGSSYIVSVTTLKLGWSNVTSSSLRNNSTKTMLGQVQTVTVSDPTTTSVTVTWSKAAGFKDHYILTCFSSGSETHTATLPNNATFAQCTSLTPGAIYNITVTTKKHGYDNVVSDVTEESLYPARPGNLNLAANGNQPNSLEITWLNSNGVVIEYNVTVDDIGSGIIDKVNDSSSSNSSHVLIRGLTPGTQYGVTVIAIGNKGKRSEASTNNFTTQEISPGPPSAPTFKNIMNTSVEVSWNKPSAPNGVITGYQILYRRYSFEPVSTPGPVISVNTTTTSQTVDRLYPGSKYEFSIVAFNSKGGGNSSVWAPVTTKEHVAGAVSNFSVLRNTSRSMIVQWGYPTQPNGVIVHYLLLVKIGNTCVQALTFNCSDCSAQTTSDAEEDLSRKTASCTNNSYSSQQYTTYGSVASAVKDLLPYTDYTFEVFAVNGEGTGHVSEMTEQTLEDVPSTRINSSSIKHNMNTTCISLTWKPPSQPNGVITKYNIIFTFPNYTNDQSLVSREVNTTSNATTWTFCELEEYWNYNFSISTFTKHGNGNLYSSPAHVVVTDEAAPGEPATFESNPSGLYNDSVLLQWSAPPRLHQNGIIRKYHLKYFDKKQFKVTFNDSTFSYRVPGLKPYTNYTFELWAETCDGCQGDNRTVEERTKEYLPSKPTGLKVEEKTYESINLTWVEPDPANGIIILYTVHVVDLDDRGNDRMENTTSTHMWIQNLAAHTRYNLTVAAWTSVGRGLFSDGEFVKTEIAKPSDPTGVKLIVLNSTSFEVRWISPEPNPGPTHYTIDVFDMGRLDSSTTGSHIQSKIVSGYSSNHVAFYGMEEYWLYRASVAAITEKGNSSAKYSDVNRTSAAAPETVRQFNVTDVNYTCVLVSWSAPLERGLNAPELVYFIEGNSTKKTPPDRVMHKIPDDVSGENYRKNFTEYMTVKSEYVYSFTITVGYNASGLGYLSSSTYPKQVTVPAGAPPPASPDVIKPLPFEEGKDLDATRQHYIQLDCQFFTNSIFGKITKSGLIVVRSTYNASGLTAQPGRHSNYVTWRESKEKDFNDPYEAIKNVHQVICSEKRIKRETNPKLEVVLIGEDADCNGDCNGYLNDGAKYSVVGYTCTKDACTWTPSVEITTVNDVTTEIVSVVMVLIVVGLIVGGVIMMRRKQWGPFAPSAEDIPFSNLDTRRGQDNLALDLEPEEDLSTMPRTKPIQVFQFVKYVEEMHKDTDLKFSEEYKRLKLLSSKKSLTMAELQSNRPKNRYINILPFDSSRVKLLPTDDDEGSDYINANYMPGYNSKREFIAAQGPLPGTVDDFWRMLWEQNVTMVVMVTQCVERGRVKCERYWPDDTEPKFYGDLIVQKRSESVLSDYTIRILDIKLGQCERIVKHIHFVKWPDFGCPSSTELLLNFVLNVRTHLTRDSRGPICVHCSAGVGRTGTFISVDRLLHQIRNHDYVDIFGMVLEMREYRCNMVQTEDQYIYIHDCIRDVLLQNDDNEENIYENTGPSRRQVAENCV